MKKTILLIFTLLIATAGFSQSVLNMFSRSQAFFQLLNQEKFDEAYAYCDTTFQSKVSEDNLKLTWYKLTTKLGLMGPVSMLSSRTQGDFYVVTVEVQFDKDTQDFLMAFNKSEKLVGFFLQPKPKVVDYLKPAYADTSLYKETEINVKTPGHSLVGILTAPKNATNFPIVVLVHGSGPLDMDETIGANKPFKDLAAGLAAKGIATIRYVKRTVLYPGDFGGVFTVKEEVTDDALAAIALARTIPAADKKQVFLLGHGLGGMLAPRLATLAPDLNGIILLAAPAEKLTDQIAEQNKYLFELAKDTAQVKKKQMDDFLQELGKIKGIKPGIVKPDSILLGLPASYWIDLNQYNQVSTAKKLNKQRLFIAQGANDYQVSVQNYNLWNAALGKQKNTSLKLYPDLNYLMSSQKERGTSEQYTIPSNVSVNLINDLAIWIKGK